MPMSRLGRLEIKTVEMPSEPSSAKSVIENESGRALLAPREEVVDRSPPGVYQDRVSLAVCGLEDGGRFAVREGTDEFSKKHFDDNKSP